MTAIVVNRLELFEYTLIRFTKGRTIRNMVKANAVISSENSYENVESILIILYVRKVLMGPRL